MEVENPPSPLPDEETHLKALTSASKFWLEFSVFDDGLDAPRAASITNAAAHKLPNFHRFPDLPPEIRLKIWSHLIVPRVVTVCCFERDSRLPSRRAAFEGRSAGASKPEEQQKDVVFNPTCPVILRICRESRALGLKHYELAFGWKVSALLSDTPIARPPRAWFNFTLDALYLVGELEAYDQYGFNSPMVYFLRREDTRRVKYVACAFEELHYPEQESDQIFGCLWHVVDRFSGATKLMLAVTPKDEEGMQGCLMLSTNNVMQKIWNGWILGTTVTSSTLADTQILLVREGDLSDVMASHAEEDEKRRATR
ncbi:hypothetical protein CkaCkLH20_12015 [Colletotrichum karsti]|uniref:2EXR domain-containing protein n=1 Tax=Colletotrichum karsti TaxID=1095194 RepID=A0A9P6LFF8_9PEZI|nr:uncharacterized protein CkaCkLH20_12015 [Colletotrichum karsti]KAF9870525.1 hypothetical protein CkaCkLH20_12015 [Colletotrichum karsti]